MAHFYRKGLETIVSYDPVLVVEDNKANQTLIIKILEILGFPHCVVTDNGADAVQACKQLQFAVILMDLRMPGIDGIQASQIILNDLALTYKPHIIAVTTDSTPERRKACTKVGMKAFLTKPVCIPALNECIIDAYQDYDQFLNSHTKACKTKKEALTSQN